MVAVHSVQALSYAQLHRIWIRWLVFLESLFGSFIQPSKTFIFEFLPVIEVFEFFDNSNRN